MPPRFQADENFNAKVIAGLLRRAPSIDFQTAQQGRIAGLTDPQVLAISAEQNRILVTHDRETMPGHFKNFIARGTSPGLLVVSQNLAIRDTIEQILLIWSATDATEWINKIGFLPVVGTFK